MKTLKWNVCLLVCGLALGACGSKGGGGSTETPKDNKSTVYYLSDGTCYKQNTNKRVSDSNCSNLDFGLEDGTCVNQNTNKDVALSNCTGNRYFAGRRGCFDRQSELVSNNLCEDDDDVSGNSGNGDRCQGSHYILYDSQGAINVTCNAGNQYCSTVILFDTRENDFVTCP